MSSALASLRALVIWISRIVRDAGALQRIRARLSRTGLSPPLYGSRRSFFARRKAQVSSRAQEERDALMNVHNFDPNQVLVMILAGGEGKRLAPLTNERAKPAVPF